MKPRKAARAVERRSKPRAAAPPKKAPAKKAVAAPAKKPGAVPAGKTAAPPSAEVRKLRSARRNLEKQLTAAVQEIGLLRQYELKTKILESELEKRTAEVEELRRRAAERPREAGRSDPAGEEQTIQRRLL